MRPEPSRSAAAIKGNEIAPCCEPISTQETIGNSVSLQFLRAAFDASQVPDKVLADELGMSTGQFSKVRNGVQPFPVALIDRLRPAIRAEWLRLMSEHEQHDVLSHATEVLTLAAVRWLKLAGLHRKRRMAKSTIGER